MGESCRQPTSNLRTNEKKNCWTLKKNFQKKDGLPAPRVHCWPWCFNDHKARGECQELALFQQGQRFHFIILPSAYLFQSGIIKVSKKLKNRNLDYIRFHQPKCTKNHCSLLWNKFFGFIIIFNDTFVFFKNNYIRFLDIM